MRVQNDKKASAINVDDPVRKESGDGRQWETRLLYQPWSEPEPEWLAWQEYVRPRQGQENVSVHNERKEPWKNCAIRPLKFSGLSLGGGPVLSDLPAQVNNVVLAWPTNRAAAVQDAYKNTQEGDNNQGRQCLFFHVQLLLRKSCIQHQCAVFEYYGFKWGCGVRTAAYNRPHLKVPHLRKNASTTRAGCAGSEISGNTD